MLRLLLDPPAAGAWNMAVDEVLLETAAATGQASLRFYEWQEPTLSLGYFQSLADRAQHPASLACPVVRRASGGGAIVHDLELTYSLALPLTTIGRSSPAGLYNLCHETLIAALNEFGIAAGLYEPCTANDEPRPPPFLCFQRRTCTDIVLGEAKIAGSAQRRRRGAVLQHGSVLLAKSASAPELPGIQEISGRTVTAGDLASGWTSRLAARLNMSAVNRNLTAEETHLASALAEQRFSALGHVHRRP